jgi:hypothetical protein
MTPQFTSRLVSALADAGHQPAMTLRDQARAQGGPLHVEQGDYERLVAEARSRFGSTWLQEQLAAANPTTSPADPVTPDPQEVGRALHRLVAAGDAHARELMAQAQANGGQLQLDPALARELVARAATVPQAPDARAIVSALQRLAAVGDARSQELLRAAQQQGGRLEINSVEACELIARAAALPAPSS